MDYITVKEADGKWRITIRRVQVLCAQEMISGASRFANTWAILKDAVLPADTRHKKNKR